MSAEDVSLILCQPDNMKGCSVCCGLFNMKDTGKKNLTAFLKDGMKREKLYRIYEEYSEPESVRDRFSHICPYQGFLAEGKPGCLIHPLSSGIEGRDRSLFAHSVCGKFLCPAHKLLSRDEQDTLIRAVNDWYLYSTAIIDPESFSFICDYARRICKIDGEDLYPLIEAGLTAHAENLSQYDGTLFFYSVPEYNLNKEKFSLNYRGDFRKSVITAIDKYNAGRG